MSKKDDIIEKMKNGIKLFQLKSFVSPSGSLNLKGKISRKDFISYSMSDGTKVHHKTGESILKSGLVEKGASERTLGGTKTEIHLKI